MLYKVLWLHVIFDVIISLCTRFDFFFTIAQTGGFKLLLGSSEGRLFYPITMILNQHLLLAAENLRLEDFYLPDPTRNTITLPMSKPSTSHSDSDTAASDKSA